MKTNEIVVPSNPTDLKTIMSAIKDVNDCMIRISSERDVIKDIIADLSEKYEIPKKYFNKMAKTYYKQSFDKEASEADDFVQLYESVTSAK
jgi:hypothetical protein